MLSVVKIKAEHIDKRRKDINLPYLATKLSLKNNTTTIIIQTLPENGTYKALECVEHLKELRPSEWRALAKQ